MPKLFYLKDLSSCVRKLYRKKTSSRARFVLKVHNFKPKMDLPFRDCSENPNMDASSKHPIKDGQPFLALLSNALMLIYIDGHTPGTFDSVFLWRSLPNTSQFHNLGRLARSRSQNAGPVRLHPCYRYSNFAVRSSFSFLAAFMHGRCWRCSYRPSHQSRKTVGACPYDQRLERYVWT